MSTKVFTKGQPVTLFRSWDGKGTVRVQDLTVYSCGAKQMVLVDAAGTKFSGRFFDPNQTDIWTKVTPRLSPAEAEVIAIEMAEAFLGWQREQIARALTKWGDQPGYRLAMEKKLAELHAPEALRKEG